MYSLDVMQKWGLRREIPPVCVCFLVGAETQSWTLLL